MTFFRALILTAFFTMSFAAFAHAGIVPNLELEKNIAYEQGRFGALYAQCGSNDEKAVIGGSLANWRTEIFRGYKGNSQELVAVQQAFDLAANRVHSDSSSCQDWIKQAAVTWKNVIVLVQNGLPSRDQ